MRNLAVYIEKEGKQVYVGNISGNNQDDACFCYSEEYMSNPRNTPVSISLPFTNISYTPKATRIFFEGLLPEGFTRRCVADWMHIDQNDYLSLLSGLGCECIGAVRILEQDSPEVTDSYQKLSLEDVKNLAKEGVSEAAQLVTKAHLSLTGASGKVGLYYDDKKGEWYLPIGNAPSTHIVKQSHVRLDRIVVNEQLCLMTAKYLGIETSESFIINMGDQRDEDILFATKRYDRKVSEEGVLLRLHQEDFAQAMGIAATDKYEHDQRGYLKQMFHILRQYSVDPMTDQLKLWDICVFNFLIGNTDNHIKNISLLYSENLRSIKLAPAYDIVSTTVYESSTRNMALSIAGKYSIDEIDRNAFEEEAKNVGLGTSIAMKRFDYLANNFTKALNQAERTLLEQGFYGVDAMKKAIITKRNYTDR